MSSCMFEIVTLVKCINQTIIYRILKRIDLHVQDHYRTDCAAVMSYFACLSQDRRRWSSTCRNPPSAVRNIWHKKIILESTNTLRHLTAGLVVISTSLPHATRGIVAVCLHSTVHSSHGLIKINWLGPPDLSSIW